LPVPAQALPGIPQASASALIGFSEHNLETAGAPSITEVLGLSVAVGMVAGRSKEEPVARGGGRAIAPSDVEPVTGAQGGTGARGLGAVGGSAKLHRNLVEELKQRPRAAVPVLEDEDSLVATGAVGSSGTLGVSGLLSVSGPGRTAGAANTERQPSAPFVTDGVEESAASATNGEKTTARVDGTNGDAGGVTVPIAMTGDIVPTPTLVAGPTAVFGSHTGAATDGEQGSRNREQGTDVVDGVSRQHA
jgi:hypothetical protein